MIDSQEFNKILPLLKQGNPEAQRVLFERCYSSVLKYILKRSRSRADAEEIASDTIAKCLQQIRSYTPPDFKNWLLTLAYRCSVDYYRGKKKQIDEVPLSKELAETIPAPEGEDPLSLILRKEWFQKFYEVFEKLPFEDRNIMVSLLEGGTPQELATAMKISFPSVKQRIHRARIRLLKLLTDEPYFSDDERVNQLVKKFKVL